MNGAIILLMNGFLGHPVAGVDLMKKHKIPVIYALYPDEGHGFIRPENRLSFYAITEGFFAKYLGGRYEQIKSDFENSSILIKEGEDLLPDKIETKK